MAYQKSKHDIGIVDVGSAGVGTTVIGMMLATQADNSKAYREYDGKYLADQFFTGVPSQAYMNPEEELILSQTDWRKGFGEDYYDDPKRYYASYGMDLRHKGMAIAGWTPTTVTKPATTMTTVPLMLNADMEDDANWTGGARDATQKYQGSYAWLVADGATATQECGTWSDAWQSKQFVLKIWVRHSAANNGATIAIWDGQARTTTASTAAAGAWQQLTVTRTLHAAATMLRVELNEVAGAGNDAWFDFGYLVAPACSGAVKDWVNYDGDFYMASGNVLSKLNAGGTAFTEVARLPYIISDLETWGDYLFIACGYYVGYWYMDSGDTMTQANLNALRYEFLATVYGATAPLYGNDGGNTIRSSTNPTTGGDAWSGQTTVGSATDDITGMVSWKGLLYMGKEDKPYYLDGTPAIQHDLAPELASALASTSGKNLWVWKNELHYPAGDQALLNTDGTTNTLINPSKYCTNLSEFSGQVFAGAGDEEWNYVIVDNGGTKVEVMATRVETIDGTTTRVWHPIAEIALKGCETCAISTKSTTAFVKALFVGSDDNTDNLYYLTLPTIYGDIVDDTYKTFKTTTYFETPWLHGGFRSEDKAWIKLTLTMGHAYNANDYFTVHYKTLEGAYVSIGNFAGSGTSMVESKFIDTTNKPFSSMIKLKFTAVTGATSRTPILLSYDVRAVMYPTIKKVVHCVVRCAREMTDRQGIRMLNQYDVVKDALDNARNNAVWPVSIRDINGDTLNVKFLPVSQETARMLPIKIEKGREQERLYHLLMLEVPLS